MENFFGLYEEKEKRLKILRLFTREVMTLEWCVIGVVQEWCDEF